MSFNTPILFIIFNRPKCTSLVFNEIRNLKPKKLYIAADGPRSTNEWSICQQVRELVQVDWTCNVQTLYRDKNLGCKLSVSSAITWFFNNENEGIILEDDCLPNLDFFAFCSAMLDRYRTDERIGHIAGSNFQFGRQIGDASYYFSSLMNIWGWATWKRVWNNYDLELSNLDLFLHLNYINNAPSYARFKEYWLNNFKATASGHIDTWDFQYMFSNLINNRLAVVPNVNLITNIGFGEQATHTTEISEFAQIPLAKFIEFSHPIFIQPNHEADIFHLEKSLKVRHKGTLSRSWKRIKDAIKSKRND